ncbi:MAG: Mur ligase domain-containing protein [Actinomycetia bacterium]|nr:Mur ligase domain-containing protein [Actinomycetes bacterium]
MPSPRSSYALGTLADRSLWFVGIGGAGMSALAAVAQAHGARVGGSDHARSDYVELLEQRGIAVTPGHDAANVPPGFEVVASTAIPPDNPEVAGRPTISRGALLADLVHELPAIVVAGAHGKTTTAAMIAFCLERLGHDPTFLIGGMVPQLGGNARAGTSWLVTEGDESDRSLELLSPTVAVITNVDLDHHATFASRAEVEGLFEAWVASLPASATVVHGSLLAPVQFELATPGEHNRHNAACALAALEAVGVNAGKAAEELAAFRGVARRVEFHGRPGGVHLYDDYGHHPVEVAAALAALRETASDRGRLHVLFQPHLFSRTLHLHAEFAEALAAADAVCVTEIYPAREQPLAGVTAKLIVDSLCRYRPGMPVMYAPELEDAPAMVAAGAVPGDIVVTMGAGDVARAIPLFAERFRP